MFLGLLIGIALFGVVLTLSNGDNKYDHSDLRRSKSYIRVAGIGMFVIATCGAIGFVAEVFLQ